MAVISIPHSEPWVVGGPAFRAILDPLIAVLPEGEDHEQVLDARAMKGLIFELMHEDQAARIAAALIEVAAKLRASLASKPDATEWDIELAGRLSTLEMLLQDLVE